MRGPVHFHWHYARADASHINDPGVGLAPVTRCQVTFPAQRSESMSTILLIILVLLLIGALPTWPYSTGWGYYPSGGLGLILVIVLVLVLMGRA